MANRKNYDAPVSGHSDPVDCMKKLDFQPETAGREILLNEQDIKFKDSLFRTRGDCAVIALALAFNKPYCCARDFIKARWERHNAKEQMSKLEEKGPGIKAFLRSARGTISREYDPLWGTPSIVYANILELPDVFSSQKPFKLIYGEEKGKPPICICDTTKTFVIDGSWGERN